MFKNLHLVLEFGAVSRVNPPRVTKLVSKQVLLPRDLPWGRTLPECEAETHSPWA